MSDDFLGFSDPQQGGVSVLGANLDAGGFNITNVGLLSAVTLIANLVTVPRTTDLTITTAMGLKVFTNTGASGTVNFTLPTAAASLGPFIFIQDADTRTLQITATGTDVIRLADTVSSAAGNVTTTHVGDVLILVGIAALKYSAIYIQSPVGFTVN